MGIVRTEDSRRLEIEEFRLMVKSCAGNWNGKERQKIGEFEDKNGMREQKLVCVTSGVSFLGVAIVNQLLLRGYFVRVMVDNEEDIERLREMRSTNNMIEVILGKLNEPQSLLQAFTGCSAVFHTSSFIDPSGLSGYTKSMVEMEERATENVAEACAITESVRMCVLTSSLLTCIWRDNTLDNLSHLVDEDCWSDEHICRDKKLWYALGKLKAEKIAWKVAEQKGLKLATICPGLITGHEFIRRNATPTIAYLKGVQQMFDNGVLATVDVAKLAEVHVCVFEEMNKTASGRYICFDQVISSNDELRKLFEEIGMNSNTGFPGNESSSGSSMAARFELSNRKITRLTSRMSRCVVNC